MTERMDTMNASPSHRVVSRLLDRSPPPASDDFIIKEKVTATNENDVSSSRLAKSKSSSVHQKSAIESLPTDTTSHILSFLLPHELFDISVISKSGNDMFNCDLLWKIKFQSRWNCLPDVIVPPARSDRVVGGGEGALCDASFHGSADKSELCGEQSPNKNNGTNRSTSGFWKRCFMNAHGNPHDLWVRHWNCVTPEDVTTVVGRTVVPSDYVEGFCCIDDEQNGILFRQQDVLQNQGSTTMQHQQQGVQEEELIEFQNQFDSPTMRCCPTCRYHPMLHPSGYSNVIEAVEAELNYAKQRDNDGTMKHHQQQTIDDPVEAAEIVASAHALLCNSPSKTITRADLQSSVSKAIHYSTQYSVAKWCRNLHHDDGQSSLLDRYNRNLNQRGEEVEGTPVKHPRSVQKEANRAFECASTYNRKIETSQYQSSGIQFLSDALFFNVHSRTSSFDQSMMKRELGHDVGDSSSISELGPNFETSHHTWHVIRLSNPDFIRPLTFRAYIQCPDVFTVYPSKGYLQPGETVYLTLGVRMKGSMRNEAFERVDVEREEVDAEMARLYATEGHLPFVPFAIRYMWATPIPMKPTDYASRPSFNNRPPFGPATQQNQTLQGSVLDHLWENVKSEADVRTIYISAHINNNYGFEEFQHATLSPFHIDIGSNHATTLTTNMPQILQKSIELFKVIENLNKETELSISGDLYRTEKKCVVCKRDWGPQSELLGRAYLLRRLECQKHNLLREQERANFDRSLRMIPSLLNRVLSCEDEDDVDNATSKIGGLNRICQLLYCMHREHIIPMKSKRLVSEEQREWYAHCERYIDDTYADIQRILVESSCRDISEGFTMDKQLWRGRGIYKTNKCTEMIEEEREATNALMYKPEPKFLHKFKSLDYNPFGMVTLGVQDDPNHATTVSMHTDMFQNDALKSFAIACLMMGNPKVLIGHGVYDRVKAPGSIIRSPSLPVVTYFRQIRSERQNKLQKVMRVLEKWSSTAAACGWKPTNSSPSLEQKHFGFKGINFEFNEQDPDGLNLIVFGQQNYQINFQTTMAHYISNVPLPGQGKLFLLSSPQFEETAIFCASINMLYTKVQPYANILHPSMEEEDIQNQEVESRNQQNHVPIDRNQQNDAVLALNVIMLIAMHLGWTIDDDYRGGFLLVDRRLLISAQWFANTIITASLLASLLSRKIMLINPFPANRAMQVGFWSSYPMKQFAVKAASSQDRSLQRFLSPDECGIAAIIVVVFYFYICRLSEREISRGYERELVGNTGGTRKMKVALHTRLSLNLERLWDACIPYFIQRWTYIPRWSRLSDDDMSRTVVHHRSMDHDKEHRIFEATSSREVRSNSSSRALGTLSYLIGLGCFILSFMACSPHFSINSLTTFFCSVAYGMSLTIESMEIVRRTTSSGLLSLAKPRRLNTLVIGFILIGQLVGSSGGVLFLAEFIVTTISLLLGGAATVTTRAIESWITFLCLSSTSLWGFLSARLGLLDGMRKKQRGFPSNILCASLCSGVAMWITVLSDGGWNDVSPGEVIVVIVREQGKHLFSILKRWYYNR